MSKSFKEALYTWLTLLFIIIGVNLNVPPAPYERQVDARNREFYPAIVVDKEYYESCSKSSCSRNYSVVIEREDKSYKDVTVSQDVYESYNVGDSIGFERHITDPKVYNHWDNHVPPYFGIFCILFALIFSPVLFCWWMVEDYES